MFVITLNAITKACNFKKETLDTGVFLLILRTPPVAASDTPLFD